MAQPVGTIVASRIMAHLVAGYPDREGALAVARGLTDGGCSYLEVQFPFSDPTADGPVIQEACHRALRAGFRLAEGFALIEEIRRLAAVPVFIMSYANPVVVKGVEGFLAEARRTGASGVIVPDLPVDADEGLFACGRQLGLEVVPVVSPNTSERRLELLRPLEIGYLYATLRRGITGAYTEIGDENLAFLARLRTLGVRILGGFGISSREQVRTLEPHVHAAVVGSALVEEIRRTLAGTATTEGAGGDDLYRAIRTRMEELAGA